MMSDEQQTPAITKDIINPPELPTPRGFNHGILVNGGRLLFLAGQDASGADGAIVPGDIVAQCDQVLRNLRTVVEAAGGAMSDITKINIYVTDRQEYKAQMRLLGHLFRSYFGAYYPATALFEVKALFQDDALIEIEGLAVIGETSPPAPLP
jgi:enamine deaminase RidA (YjgF/YER057c/UK114 family)